MHYLLLEPREKSLEPNNDLAESQERVMRMQPAKRVQAVWTMREAFITTRSKQKSPNTGEGNIKVQSEETSARAQEQPEIKGLKPKIEEVSEAGEVPDAGNQKVIELLWANANKIKPAIHVTLDKKLRDEFVQGYQSDVQFKMIFKETKESADS